MLIPKGVTGFKVQPARRLRTYAKAKKTYGGLDKDFLVQSGVFSVESPARYGRDARIGRDKLNRSLG
ncbi:hypothetical protein Taro_053932 [Colocasia esculenta]|uniref:Uncharacterized protein n=1 Tax=Colocasia esculenta TaxID=4460 RepID=A0A843XP05_COLES|nr:hypothetical protein [Colocasia esculenta]